MNSMLKIVVIYCSWTVGRFVNTAPRLGRLSLAEHIPSYHYTNINGEPGTYAFGYDLSDPLTGNSQYRNEERYSNGTVVGGYGYVDGSGKPRYYSYIADEKGYRVKSTNPSNNRPMNIAKPSQHKDGSISWSRKKLQGQKKYPKPNVFKNKGSGNIYFSKGWETPIYYY